MLHKCWIMILLIQKNTFLLHLKDSNHASVVDFHMREPNGIRSGFDFNDDRTVFALATIHQPEENNYIEAWEIE